MSFTALILAAGKGTRMQSELPKVLHTIAGKPMLQHVVDAARAAGASEVVVVYGHGGEAVPEAIDDVDHFAHQAQQLGTGHAVRAGIDAVSTEQVVVLYGDVPLIKAETIYAMAKAQLAVLVADLAAPAGYGRMIIDAEHALRIVEHKDASDAERAINTINTGIIAAPSAALATWLSQLDNNNAQGEYYLTDVVEMAAQALSPMRAIWLDDPDDGAGINDRSQQAAIERRYQARAAQALLQSGVALRDPSRLDIYGSLRAGRDVCIEANVQIKGEVVLGDHVTIEANCVLCDCQIGDHSRIMAFSHIDNATVGAHANIGPYARLRPGTALGDHTKIGNFVETKNITMAEGSKANHLSYLGDASIGKNSNIGAGTITCNYDGANKHQTKIGERVFVGSNTALVAPVSLGDDSTIGAGSTVTQDVEAKTLTVARAHQKDIANWPRPSKKQ